MVILLQSSSRWGRPVLSVPIVMAVSYTHLVPAFEEIINSPITTRILEVYRKGGDSVDVGTPILKLELQSAETDYKKMLDEEPVSYTHLDVYKRQKKDGALGWDIPI